MTIHILLHFIPICINNIIKSYNIVFAPIFATLPYFPLSYYFTLLKKSIRTADVSSTKLPVTNALV